MRLCAFQARTSCPCVWRCGASRKRYRTFPTPHNSRQRLRLTGGPVWPDRQTLADWVLPGLTVICPKGAGPRYECNRLVTPNIRAEPSSLRLVWHKLSKDVQRFRAAHRLYFSSCVIKAPGFFSIPATHCRGHVRFGFVNLKWRKELRSH